LIGPVCGLGIPLSFRAGFAPAGAAVCCARLFDTDANLRLQTALGSIRVQGRREVLEDG
jgi:hypothetical protein